jgi:hypothetical protein
VNAALEGYRDQLTSIRQEVPGIVAGLTDEQGRWSPAGARWSIVQCFEHLNATARSFVPAMDQAIEDGRSRGLSGSGPFVYSWFERLFLQATEPPVRLRLPAPRALRPASGRLMADVVAEFMEWQNRLSDCLDRADGLDLAQARVRSSDFPLFAWSLGSLFAITLAHERRHLRQAREVRRALTEACAS